MTLKHLMYVGFWTSYLSLLGGIYLVYKEPDKIAYLLAAVIGLGWNILLLPLYTSRKGSPKK